MLDYQKGKIYKLWSPQGTDEEVYYGSTCNDLRFRKSRHKSKNDCRSKILFEKYDDVRIELVEDYPCNNKAELNKREGHYIRENKCLNKNISGRTMKEYYEDNKESIKEYYKKWKENNKEKYKEYKLKDKDYYKEYYKKNKERYRKNKEEALVKE